MRGKVGVVLSAIGLALVCAAVIVSILAPAAQFGLRWNGLQLFVFLCLSGLGVVFALFGFLFGSRKLLRPTALILLVASLFFYLAPHFVTMF